MSETDEIGVELASSHVQKLLLAAARYAVGVRIVRPDGTYGSLYNGGSGIAVEANGSFFLITALHVLEHYSRLVHEGVPCLLLAGNHVVTPVRELFRDSDKDIVAIALSDLTPEALGSEVYHPVTAWPPPPAKAGSVVLLAGFPRVMQSLNEDASHLEFAPLGIGEWIASSGEHRFAVQLQRAEWARLTTREMPGPGIDLRGISGGPAFNVSDDRLHLVGIVTDVMESAERVYVAHLCSFPMSM